MTIWRLDTELSDSGKGTSEMVETTGTTLEATKERRNAKIER